MRGSKSSLVYDLALRTLAGRAFPCFTFGKWLSMARYCVNSSSLSCNEFATSKTPPPHILIPVNKSLELFQKLLLLSYSSINHTGLAAVNFKLSTSIHAAVAH